MKQLARSPQELEMVRFIFTRKMFKFFIFDKNNFTFLFLRSKIVNCEKSRCKQDIACWNNEANNVNECPPEVTAGPSTCRYCDPTAPDLETTMATTVETTLETTVSTTVETTVGNYGGNGG